MPSYIVNFNLKSVNRAQMRRDLITTFINEQPGTGNGNNASRYRYNVENLNANYSIFLKRPTMLNKGFDFTVNISGMLFKKQRTYSNPSHSDIINALTYCKNNFSVIYRNDIIPILNNIYNCKPVNVSVLSGATFIDYQGVSHPIEIILLAVKWLFMEQDCAYWNYSGRAMFYNALKQNNLV
ncbi:MAG: hypothetical protein J6D23_07010 [Clostridia bacterium]|nr:hypothetical protein [Clostridia bacterium]